MQYEWLIFFALAMLLTKNSSMTGENWIGKGILYLVATMCFIAGILLLHK